MRRIIKQDLQYSSNNLLTLKENSHSLSLCCKMRLVPLGGGCISVLPLIRCLLLNPDKHLTNCFYLPATMAGRLNKFTRHYTKSPAFGMWWMRISNPVTYFPPEQNTALWKILSEPPWQQVSWNDRHLCGRLYIYKNRIHNNILGSSVPK